ncbi:MULTISPECIES: hypothetical protein [unclassified Crossiella]|uniref:hypothetical protein n=1 Tax=unclassified Crossiella TaxID=2620835 RepID=UPI0020003499|nr:MULTISPECIES: hypothetical protein [unclassified Crossiella]MCK2241538.1 hypothetical protein [Crossiella sp. S99.2]MCK2255590.1 hypothetical protein [Crossiella sp. S99.1]
MDATPLPDPADWQRIARPDRRLSIALAALYEYYPTLDGPPGAEHESYVDGAVARLAPAFQADAARAEVVAGAIRHAISFPTWQSLVRTSGLVPLDAVRLMVAMVKTAANGPGDRG